MRDLPRVGFLLVVDTFLVVALVMLLSGCVGTPIHFQDGHGDFDMHIGSNAYTVAPPKS